MTLGPAAGHYVGVPASVRLYIRCSTDEQAHSALGLEAQEATLRQAALARFPTAPVALYVDAGHSGAHDRRPAYRRLRRDLRAGDVLLISRLDRVSRSLVDFGRLVADSRRRRWSIVCLDPDLDLTTANGELIANILVAVAQWERCMTSTRTREALAARRARGLPVGTIPATSPELVQRIARMRGEGMTLPAICARLQADGVPAPRGGSVWHPSTVSRVLRRAS